VAQVRRFDDDAWAALANRGLLRRARKDLESVVIEVVGDGAALVVAVGDRTVRFPEAGPARATCSCPSVTTCQHVITAGLWLANEDADVPGAEPPDHEVDGPTQPEAGQSGQSTEASGGVEAVGAIDVARTAEVDDADALRDELLSLDVEALVAHAGRAGVRWAAQFMDDLEDDPDGVRIGGGRHTVITFARPPVTLRFMGGGLGGLVADQRLPSPERYQVAAVLAYQRANGLVLEAPAVRSATIARQLPQRESRARLRDATRRLLTDTVGIGVSHLSTSVHERYTTLATWAQGAEYHRLALLLRRLADHVELLLTRSARADEHRLLDVGLVCALEAADARGEAPKDLVGRARNTYDAVRFLELFGLGGVPWRTGSGYQGLTLLFWSPSGGSAGSEGSKGSGTFLSWTDARPLTMAQFDPVARWATPGPWTGLASPSATSGRRVVLLDAQVSSGGRISGVERTSASTQPIDAASLASLLPVRDSWAEVAQGKDPARRSLLDPPAPLESWAVLRPTSFGRPTFDVARQTLLWPLVDRGGSVLVCEIAYSTFTARLIERVEALADHFQNGTLDGPLVVARLRVSPLGLVAEPLSLIRPGRGPEAAAVDALHFDPVPDDRGGRVSKVIESLRKRREVEAPPEPAHPLVDLPVPLVSLRGWLEGQAERGVSGVDGGVARGALDEHHRQLREAGLRVFVPAPSDVEPAEALLRSHYLVQQVTLALLGDPSP
jgi:hypothetical protein